MFTAKSIDGIGRLIQLGSTMNVLPFVWNSKKRRLEIGSRKQKTILIFIITYMYWEAAYQLYRLIIGHRNKSVPLTQYLKLVELFVTRLTALTLQAIAFVYQEDVKYFLNQLLNMNARFIKVYGQNHIRDPCVKIFRFYFWFIVIHPAVTAIIYAGDNKDTRYWHGGLLPSRIQPYFVPLFIVVEYWISVLGELGCAYVGSFMVAYYKATPIWMNELGIMIKEGKTNCKEIISLYRALLILNRAFNNANSLILAYGALSLLADLTISLFCSLRVSPAIGFPGGLHSPIASVAFILLIEATVRPTGNLTSPSSEFLTTFTQIVTGRRYGTLKRGHVKNMEKERKKVMKIKRYIDRARKGSGILDVTGRMIKKNGSLWETSLAIVAGQNSRLATQIRAKKGNRARVDDIEGIWKEKTVSAAVSSDRQKSLELIATTKSMYPMVVDCFIFFQFEKSTIFDFYCTVLDQTISALLVT